MSQIKCTWCFSSIDENNVQYRCKNSNCSGRAPDEIYARYHNINVVDMGKIIDAPRSNKNWLELLVNPGSETPAVKCPECSQITHVQVCPVCHDKLRRGALKFPQVIISVFGGVSTGKTCYITALIKTLSDAGSKYGLNCRNLSDDDEDRWEEMEGKVPDPTRPASIDPTVKIPYTLRITINGTNNELNVHFFDVAGEDTSSEASIEESVPQLFHSQGVIVMIDPLQMTKVREDLEKANQTNFPAPNQKTAPNRVINRFINLYEERNRDEKPSIPVAFTLSKIDRVQPLLLSEPTLKQSPLSPSYSGQTVIGNRTFDLGDAQEMSKAVAQFIRRWDTRTYNSITNNFSEFTFSGVSALGSDPGPNNQPNKKASPYKVEQPFLWILSQLDYFPTDYTSKGDTLLNLKHYEEEATSYEQAIHLDANNVSAYIGKADALYHLKSYLDAVHTYEQAIHLDASNVSAYIGKADALHALRRYKEALETYEQAIHLDASNVSAYIGKGNILYDLNRYDDAISFYNQVILIAPNNSSAYLNKGHALYDLKRYNDALSAYEQAILLAPDEATAYFHKGLSLENLIRYEEALATYKLAVHLNPNIELAGPQGLLVRIKSAQEFLKKAGFDLSEASDPFSLGFLALAKKPIWHKRFPKGLYVRILFDHTLDHSTVQNIHFEAKPFSNYALVLINCQPAISGWMAIAGLRLEDTEPFFLLQMDESSIKEGAASNKEYQTLSLHINKHLGNDLDPFDTRYPVFDAISFFGRESLTDEITNALKQGQSLGLFGLRKMGKSSVLQRLQKKVNFPTAYIYLRKGDSLEGIYKRILEGWLIDIRIKYPDLKWSMPQITIDSDLRRFFDSAAKNLLILLGSFTDTPLLAIFLDEIESISPYHDGDEDTLQLYINLIDSVRGLQQETNNLSLLIAGEHPTVARRNYFWGNQKNPLYQVISERFLLPLEKEDCNYMIRGLGQQINLTFDNEAVEYILHMSGAHPFLARQVCSLAYKTWGNAYPISLEVIQKSVQDFVNNPATASYFDDYGLWGELGKDDIWGEESYVNHKILSSLAASPGKLAKDEICPNLNRKLVERTLITLTEGGIVSTVDDAKRYYITFGLFRNWIRLHKLGLE